MPFFSFQEQKLFFEIKESKTNKAIFFIHGSGSGSQIWRNQLELDLDYNLIAIDLPSHFQSEYYSKVSLDLYLDAVIGLVDHLRYQEIILCGHSLGGAIAQAYYYKYPKELKALILVGTGGRLKVSPIIFEVLQKDIKEYIDMIPIGIFYKKASKDIVSVYASDVLKLKPEVIFADFKICDGFDTLDLTSTIDVPCLIICGKNDILTPVKYSQYFDEKIKNSVLVVIKNAGHMVMLEKPQEFNKAILNFINSL